MKPILQRYSVHLLLVLLGGVITYLAYEEALGLYTLSVLMFMGVNIILSTSLNLVNGNMGEFSCGHAGFMCVGAYVSSILGVWLFSQDKVFGSLSLPAGSLPHLPACWSPFLRIKPGATTWRSSPLPPTILL